MQEAIDKLHGHGHGLDMHSLHGLPEGWITSHVDGVGIAFRSKDKYVHIDLSSVESAAFVLEPPQRYERLLPSDISDQPPLYAVCCAAPLQPAKAT
jgi:hypothetical protein